MKIPKIAEALGLIDDRHVDFAEDFRPPKFSSRYLTIAACAVLAIGLGIFAYLMHNLHIDKLPDERIIGNQGSEFYATVNHKLAYLDGEFLGFAGDDETVLWLTNASSRTAVDEADNLYSFIHYFDIPEGAAREILSRDGYSGEEIDLILSDDAEAVAERFAAENAIVKGKNLYSPSWLYSHSVEEYAEAGISGEDVGKVLEHIDDFGLSDREREEFEKKLSETMNYVGGALVYNDGTMVFNPRRALYEKDFTLIDCVFDGDVCDFIFYLAPNDKTDKNIYACAYSYDQLIAASCQSAKSFPALEAVFRFTDYYTERQPAPVGAVIRLAWDGLADNEYSIMRLPIVSRIEFSDQTTPYYNREISDLQNSLDGRYLDPELLLEMWGNYRAPGDEHTFEVSGAKPYKMSPASDHAEKFTEKLRKNAQVKYPKTVLTDENGETYAATGCPLTEEEFAEFMYAAEPQPQAPRTSLPEGVDSDFSDLLGTPEFEAGDFTLTDRAIEGKLLTNCAEARLWRLGGEFIFARLDHDVLLPDRKPLHGWLFRKIGGENGEEKAEEAAKYTENLEFLNHLSKFKDGDFVYLSGQRYVRNGLILTKQNCEDFIAAAEYIGESTRSQDHSDLCANALESGIPLYRYDDFILAKPDEPITVGEGENGEGVVIYGWVYVKE